MVSSTRKYYDADQPHPNPRRSVDRSGIMVMIQGTGFDNPQLVGTLTLFDADVIGSPSLDTPTLAWS